LAKTQVSVNPRSSHNTNPDEEYLSKRCHAGRDP
jgi:hypothetical protein